MKFTEILKKEHEVIKVMLSILGAVVTKFEKGKKIPNTKLLEIMDFFMVFTDQCHHGKEEEILFPAMVKVGFPDQGGFISLMLKEHNYGRKLVDEMKNAITNIKLLKKISREIFIDAANDYIVVMNEHIDTENGALYPIAELRIPLSFDAKLVESFDKLEEERIGAGKHEKFHVLIEKLKKTYLNQDIFK
jgi:hemerythrin-like domain-containing protein